MEWEKYLQIYLISKIYKQFIQHNIKKKNKLIKNWTEP